MTSPPPRSERRIAPEAIAGPLAACGGFITACVTGTVSGRYPWYSLLFAPVLTGISVTAIVAMSRNAAWYERTPGLRIWSKLLGPKKGRTAAFVTECVTFSVGVALGLWPTFLPKRTTGTVAVVWPVRGVAYDESFKDNFDLVFISRRIGESNQEPT